MILLKHVHLEIGTMRIASRTYAEVLRVKKCRLLVCFFSVDRGTPRELTSHLASRRGVLECSAKFEL